MRVLFCTDGSQISLNAIYNFSSWFNNFELDVLSVSDMTYFTDNVLIEGSELLQRCADRAECNINTAKKYLSDKGIKADKYIKLCGNAVDIILDLESENKYDFIVMGSNDKRGINKWLGSVSQEVASQSKTSVYISKSKIGSKKLLLPIDYVQNDLQGKINRIISEMNLVNTNICLISAYKIPDYLMMINKNDSNWIFEVENNQRKYIFSKILSVENIFLDKGIKIEDKSLIKGDPAQAIINYIADNEISLTITQMKKRKNTFSFSSISRRVLELAKSDILVYKV